MGNNAKNLGHSSVVVGEEYATEMGIYFINLHWNL